MHTVEMRLSIYSQLVPAAKNFAVGPLYFRCMAWTGNANRSDACSRNLHGPSWAHKLTSRQIITLYRLQDPTASQPDQRAKSGRNLPQVLGIHPKLVIARLHSTIHLHLSVYEPAAQKV
jgi:hypothetical protein